MAQVFPLLINISEGREATLTGVYWALRARDAQKNSKMSPEGRGSGSEKGVFWKKGSFQKSPSARDSREFRDSRDFREPPGLWKIKENPTIFLEILENLERF